MPNKTANQALTDLKAGNQRFINAESKHNSLSIQQKQKAHASGQKPFAIILGCSDSRVPAEIVFDQGVGDLFVIRVAGNVVAPSQIGSIEYAIEMFDTALVVVLGHSHCGAVEATLQAIESPDSIRSQNIQSIVKRIRPAIAPLNLTVNDTQQAVEANIAHSVAQLENHSDIIENHIKSGTVKIVGACYDLATGVINFSS
ncbi:carbonic anhydrase [Marinicella rhabdoformis]|uniref:carbonic anhydrase n=1 Tax=Marinicella rhabdoformis TaxID=2580566 RepID=UPI0012AEDD76|nr:carbonic anhydrase [Marinicella rhabdoformis]